MNEDGEDEVAHFSGDGTDGDAVMFASGAKLGVEGFHGRVAGCSAEGGEPNGVSEVGRTAFRNVRLRSDELAGLVDLGIKAGKGDELRGGFKAMDVADFREDGSTGGQANAGDGGNGRVDFCDNGLDFLVKQGKLIFGEGELLKEELDLERKGIKRETHYKGIGGGLLDGDSFFFAEPTARSCGQQVGQFSCGDGFQILGHWAGFQQRFTGLAEHIGKQVFKFRKSHIQQGDNPAFAVAAVLNQRCPKTGQLPQPDDVLVCQRRLRVLSKSHDLGDDKGIPAVVFGFSDIEVPKRFATKRIDDPDIKTQAGKMRMNAQPIVSGGFHTDDQVRLIDAKCSKMCDQFFTAGSSVFKRQAHAQGFTGVVNHTGLMTAFCNVDSAVKHKNNLPTKIRRRGYPPRHYRRTTLLDIQRSIRYPAHSYPAVTAKAQAFLSKLSFKEAPLRPSPT